MTLKAVSRGRLDERAALLTGLDRFRRQVDANAAKGLYDSFTEQALGVLTSPKLIEALDLEREDPKVRARYGKDNPKVLGYSLDKGYQAHHLEVPAGAACR